MQGKVIEIMGPLYKLWVIIKNVNTNTEENAPAIIMDML